MATAKKLRGSLVLSSNSPGAPTGYGVQAEELVNRAVRDGLDVAVLSNYGLEARTEIKKTAHGKYAHYPKGLRPYSDDVIRLWYDDFVSQRDGPSALMTLYDAWVYNDLVFDDPILPWVPLDHVTLPPLVRKFLDRDNVNPIAMSEHGERQLTEAGIDSTYIPHGVNTQVFKPTKKMFGRPTREYMEIPDDGFLVSIVAANKANKILHRKAIAEQILAFATFRRKFPNSYLYLHSEPSRSYGGFDLPTILKAVGLDESCVRIADRDRLRVGYSQNELAALYSTSDVLLNATYGEGFGVPTVEAQACGTRVITSSWSASGDLAGPDSWLVEGQPWWDDPQSAFFQVPMIPSIIGALEQAHEAPRGTSEASIEFAKAFDFEAIWQTKWIPYLRERFSA